MQTRDSVSRVEDVLGRWKLSEPLYVAETPTSRVYRVKTRKYGHAALKLLLPNAGDDERLGGEMLEYYAGQGAARVFARTPDAVLIEWLDGESLSTLVRDGKDAVATDIICQTVQQLHAPRTMPPPMNLVPLAERFQALFNANRSLWPPAARDMLLRAQIVARDLLESVREEVPLHGDLHHDNILFSARSWVAIDPKGLFGDPAYEVANSFMNPLDATDLCAGAGRVDAMADTVAGRLGFDKVRVLGFAVAHTALSACWDMDAKRAAGHQLAILPRLIRAHGLAAESRR